MSTPPERARKTVESVLPRTVQVKHSRSPDTLEVQGEVLSVAWAGEGYLGDIRPFLNQPAPKNLVVVARQMSPGARDALAQAGISWADESGAAEIAIGSIIVSRTSRPTKAKRGPDRWTPAVVAVVEALLCGVRATVSATEAATGLSTGSCTNALRYLSKIELLRADAGRGRNSARQIADPRALLDAYSVAAHQQRPLPHIQVGVVWRDFLTEIGALGEEWQGKGLNWALTGSAAASVIAPFLSTVSHASIYVEAHSIAELEAIARDSNLRQIEGGRLRLAPFPTVAVERLNELHDGLRIAPWPRVFADSLQEGVRGEEAAEHLLETVGDGRAP